MQIKPLTDKDIIIAAALHYEHFSDLSTTLGYPYVIKLYELLLSRPAIHHSLGAWEKNELIGVIIVTNNIPKTHRLMHQIITAQSYSTLFRKILTAKISPLRLLKRLLFEQELKRIQRKNDSEIVILFVRNDKQRHGIGSELIKQVIKQQRKIPTTYLYVDTRAENKKAVMFYRKNGFELLGNFWGNAVLRFTDKY